MKHYTHIAAQRLLIAMLLGLCHLSAFADAVLTVPDLSVPPGRSIAMPVRLDTDVDLVAAEFTLTLPEGLTLDVTTAVADKDRCPDHQLVVRQTAPGVYKAMLFSPTNTTINRRTGTLLTIQLNAAANVVEGSQLPLTMTNVVLAARNGDNKATGFSAGKVTIVKLPDLTVTDVSFQQTSINPAEQLDLTWTVENIGQVATGPGWQERIYLVQGERQRLIGTTLTDEQLEGGATAQRMTSIALPELLGIDGQVNVRVEIVPTSLTDEPQWLTANNSLTSQASLQLAKRLNLASLSSQKPVEADAGSMEFVLTRSGNTAEEEPITLDADGDTRLTLPAGLAFKAGEAVVRGVIEVAPNKRCDYKPQTRLTFQSASGTAQTLLAIEDDTQPALQIAATNALLKEGDVLHVDISTERAVTAPLTVSLAISEPARFDMPQTVVIAAGESSVALDIPTRQDEIAQATAQPTLTAAAEGYTSATQYLILEDDDTPQLSLTLSQNDVKEDAGPLAITATIRRLTLTEKSITIALTDDTDTLGGAGIYYGSRRVVMKPGQIEAEVLLGPIDNDLADGDRTYHVKAEVYVAACACTVASSSGDAAAASTAALTVRDNDGPALSLSTSSSALAEGDTMTVTLRRNSDSSAPLAANIAVGNSRVVTPATVEIAAGAQTATFEILSPENDTPEDGFTTSLTANAEGHSAGVLWFTVTDQSLPDAVITALDCPEEMMAGASGSLTLTLGNTGISALPELTPVNINIGDESYTRYLQEPLPAGAQTTLAHDFTLPRTVGEMEVSATVNKGKTMVELNYTNNASPVRILRVTAPTGFDNFAVSGQNFQAGQTVNFTGKAKAGFSPDDKVEVYLVDHKNARIAIDAILADDGSFTAQHTVADWERGVFSCGVCYVGENKRDAMAEYCVNGLDRTTKDDINLQGHVGETLTATVGIVNPSLTDATNIEVEVVSKPEGVELNIEAPASISAGAQADIKVHATGQQPSAGTDWEKIALRVVAHMGAESVVELPINVNFYCNYIQAVLSADISQINTTVAKGKPRELQFQLTNKGGGPTGAISLALPAWISSLMPERIASLNPGESVDMAIRLNPKANWDLRHIERGKIGINCENGNGLAMPFSVEVVGEENGNLVLQLRDPWSYELNDFSHLAGMNVKLLHPVTGSVIASAESPEGGDVAFNDLPEGPYVAQISGEGHQDMTTRVSVDPGRTTTIEIVVPLPNPTYNYEVVETEVEDEYEINTIVTYETNVPIPVVVISGPNSIDGDKLRVGESVVFTLTATNKGLITAFNSHFDLPDIGPEFTIEALSDISPYDLPAQSSRDYVLRVTRITPAEGRAKATSTVTHPMSPCMLGMEYWYKFHCGTELKDNAAAYRMALKTCAISVIYETLAGAIGGGPGGPGGPGGFGGGSGGVSPESSGSDAKMGICDPCMAAMGEALIDVALSFAPGAGSFISIGNTLSNTVINRRVTPQTYIELVGAIGSMVPGPIGLAVNTLVGVEVLGTTYLGGDCQKKSGSQVAAKASAVASPNEMIYEESNAYAGYLRNFNELANLCFGSDTLVWRNVKGTDLQKIAEKMAELAETYPFTVTEDDMREMKPEPMSLTVFKRFVDRMNNITTGMMPAVADSIFDNLGPAMDYERECMSQGKPTPTDRFLDAKASYLAYIHNQGNGVCASVTLKFKQSLYMTRQAFRGTLTMHNGHELKPMRDVKLNIVVNNEEGVPVTPHEMEIHPEPDGQKGFSGTGDIFTGLDLGSAADGQATVIYIPTVYAAPEIPVLYNFGGTISYIDPYTDTEKQFTLSPALLTVKPSPWLSLTYFMQRDVWGDDPMTEEIEPSQEAEFALLMQNNGKGDATNVRMVTYQPEIVDNEKGLALEVKLSSTLLKDQERTLVVGESVASDFGDIPAGESTWGRWMFKANLMGHFTEYKTEANHVTSYGNPDLTLVDLEGVSIHELIHTAADANGHPAWLVNDVFDENDEPDNIYLTDGSVMPVTRAFATLKPLDNDQYLLTIEPGHSGWVYGTVRDPNYGRCQLLSVWNSHEAEENMSNFYLTDRIMPDGGKTIYEDLLHFIVYLGDDNGADSRGKRVADGSGTTFTLSFTPRPAAELEVVQIVGGPQEMATEPVQELQVQFNKPIDASSFNADDLRLTVQGKPVSLADASISPVNGDAHTYTIGLAHADCGNGFYCLTVNAEGINDAEGKAGQGSKMATWNYYKDGKVALGMVAQPEGAGIITPATGNYTYGEPLTLTQTPAEGYDFSAWSVDNETVSTDATYAFSPTSDQTITARYALRQLNLEFAATEGGVIKVEGTPVNGKLRTSYGTRYLLVAAPDEAYEFVGWTVNGEQVSANPTYEFVLTADTHVEAAFKQVVFSQSVCVMDGWNWLSSYVGNPATEFEPWAEQQVFVPNGMTKLLASQVSLAQITGRKAEASTVTSAALTGIATPEGATWPANADEGDAIMSLNGGFSVYEQGQWHGTLSALQSGQGYLYSTKAEPKMLQLEPCDNASEFSWIRQDHPDVMALIIRVDDCNQRTGFALTALCDNQERSSETVTDELHYLVVHGNAGDELRMRLAAPDGNDYTSQAFTLQEGVYGTPQQPVVITLTSEAVGINGLPTTSSRNGVYSLSGVLLMRSATQSQLKALPAGVYLVDGKKMVVK